MGVEAEWRSQVSTTQNDDVEAIFFGAGRDRNRDRGSVVRHDETTSGTVETRNHRQ